MIKNIGKNFDETKIKNLDSSIVKNMDGELSDTPSKWAKSGNVYTACEEAVDKLPITAFTSFIDMSGTVYLVSKNVITDNLLRLPDAKTDEVVNYIQTFWDSEEKFKKLGFLYKKGILLYGEPGVGKTALLNLVSKDISDKGGIVLYGEHPGTIIKTLEVIRTVEPKRPIVVIMEDVDSIVYYYGDKALTALLDGEHSTENVVYVATTNYIENLPARLVDRPSRFDLVQELQMPTPEARRAFLEAKTELTPSQLNMWVELTDDFSIADLKEVIILTSVYNKTVEEAIARLRENVKDTTRSKD